MKAARSPRTTPNRVEVEPSDVDADAKVVGALREGRPEAAAALFDRHAEYLTRVLTRVLGPDQELQDLLQDVFVAALESLDRLQDPTALKPWLSRIAVHIVRGRIQRRARWRLLLASWDAKAESVPAVLAEPEVVEALRATYRVLDRMPANERIPLALRFVGGMDLTEVAYMCDVSLATVKRRLTKAQKRFVALAGDEPELAEWIRRGARWKQS